MYYDDTGEGFAYNDGSGSAVTDEWMGCLLNYYAKVTNLLMCPSTQYYNGTLDFQGIGNASTSWDHVNQGGTTSLMGGYGINGWLYDANAQADFGFSQAGTFGKHNTIPRPSQTP